MTATTRPRAAIGGALAAALALGVAELLAGIGRSTPSLVVAVGDAVIDLSPGSAVSTGIEVFGTSDKPALIIGIVALSVAIGARTGIAAVARWWVAPVVFGAFALLGIAAARRLDGVPLVPAGAVAIAGAASGVLALALLLGILDRAADGTPTVAPDGPRSRRTFVGRALAIGGVAAIAPVVGRRLAGRFNVAGIRADIVLPTTAAGAAAPDGPFDVAGLSPRITPNDDFYRIDTALTVPQIDPATWSLRVTGLVEREIELGFDELLDMATDDIEITLACVSNEVGGDLVGNARWTGVRLRRLLDRAGVRPEGTQVIGTSVDGFTAGFPTELAHDGRPALVALGMNGEPLPVSHGFPARLVVSGLYGYVSATKWLSEIRLTRFDEVDGYWVPRGWAKEAPVKTQSRIDVPRHAATLMAGTVPIAGVAWAQTRGVERVQVRVDDGPWLDAALDDLGTAHTWRQWHLAWQAEPGDHVLAVRATDGDGVVQTSEPRQPRPDGATGHHSVSVRVDPA